MAQPLVLHRPQARAETMHGWEADADAPDLGVRVADQQPLRSSQGVVRHLEVFGVHINRHGHTAIVGLHLWPYALLLR